jgi:hypothetical protein
MRGRGVLLSALAAAAVFGGSYAVASEREAPEPRVELPGSAATPLEVDSASLRTELLGAAQGLPALSRLPLARPAPSAPAASPPPAPAPPPPEPAPQPTFSPPPPPPPAPAPQPAPAPAPSPPPADTGQDFDDSG